MRKKMIAVSALLPLCTMAAMAFAQTAPAPADRSYVGQMTEDQIRQKLAGEGFSDIADLKKVPVTKYRWTGTAMQSGKKMDVTIDELGHVSASAAK
jgi:hypothetical protein